MKSFALFFLTASSVLAQTNDFATAKFLPAGETNPPALISQQVEQVRTECLQGRRCICGKIIKLLPGGLVVDSGYTNLMRAPLNKSWLISGTVTASRAPNVIEGSSPGCVAYGLVFVTNLPKSRGAKPRQYDYVDIIGYPAGQTTYSSVGEVKHTVPRFAASLAVAVQVNLVAVENQK